MINMKKVKIELDKLGFGCEYDHSMGWKTYRKAPQGGGCRITNGTKPAVLRQLNKYQKRHNVELTVF